MSKYRSPESHARQVQWQRDYRERLRTQRPEELRAMNRRFYLNKTYGLSPAAFDALLEGQGGGCAACGDTERLVVDHDHVTGQVRGILCAWCNSALGHAKDDPLRLEALAAYLRGQDA